MRLSLFCAAALLGGCVTSPIQQLTEGTYTVSINTALGLTTRSALQDKAIDRAEEFCAKQGKVAHLINENGAGVVGLTNVGVTIAFSCVQPSQQKS